MGLTVTPITPTIGAEVAGFDATNPSRDFDALWDAFNTFGVVFLRDQPALTPEQHSALARCFGDIHVHPASRGKPAEFPGLLRMKTHGESRVAAGNRWHSDVSCDAEPPQASILQLHQVPPLGGDTLFAGLGAAYDALSDRMKVLLDGLTALHSGEEPFRRLFNFDSAGNTPWPENHHPIVRRHAQSGRPVLFVDREFTHSIDDLPKEEGRSLLDFLFNHAERVAFQCRFVWNQNGIAIWDNRAVLHHAMWDYWPEERAGNRVSVVGEAPIMWQLGQDAHAPDRVVKLSA
jgi:taurine dioxygenase